MLFLLFIFFFSFKAHSANPFLVFDQKNCHTLGKKEKWNLKKFRTYFEFSHFPLKMSGSAQFSEFQVSGLFEALRKNSQNIKIWVVDLRQEAHFFVNKCPVSFFSPYFKQFWGMKASQIQTFENQQAEILKIRRTLEIQKTLSKKDGHVGTMKANFINNPIITSEQKVVESLGGHYLRLSVTDHRHPSPQEVDAFLKFVKSLGSNDWVHFHCRGGSGRTSTFMMMFDIVKNSACLSLKEIAKRNKESGGADISLKGKHRNHRSSYINSTALRRSRFIKEFYRYVRSGTGLSWTCWIKEQGLDL